MSEIYGGLIILFVLALVGGYIAYVNNDSDNNFGNLS